MAVRMIYTRRGAELAAGRREAAEAFYHALLAETQDSYEVGRQLMEQHMGR